MVKKVSILVLSFACLAASAAVAIALGDYAWRYRPLLVFAENANDLRLAKQVAIVTRNKRAFEERDIVVVVVQSMAARAILGQSASLSAVALRDRYRVGSRDFRVLLVGKDSGVKLSSNSPVSAHRLFGTIDSMPMRQKEMQNRSR